MSWAMTGAAMRFLGVDRCTTSAAVNGCQMAIEEELAARARKRLG